MAIDLLPGPSEILVLADGSAKAAWIAADLLAQAEHGKGSAILLPEETNDRGFAMTSSFTGMILAASLAFDTVSVDRTELLSRWAAGILPIQPEHKDKMRIFKQIGNFHFPETNPARFHFAFAVLPC